MTRLSLRVCVCVCVCVWVCGWGNDPTISLWGELTDYILPQFVFV